MLAVCPHSSATSPAGYLTATVEHEDPRPPGRERP